MTDLHGLDFNGMASVITALTALLAAFTSLISVLISLRNGRKIEQVHLATNSMKDELVKTVGEAEHAKGYKQATDEATNGNKK